MDRQTILGIITLQIAAFTIGTDFTGALLLVPPIENEFSADITTTQWVLNMYALTFAACMIAGGRFGDMYGRRRIMLIGHAFFITASLACLLSPTIGWLIAARGLQGIGAALLFPSILAYAANIAGEEKRSLVIGLILAGITTGNVFGPLIGGAVVTFGDWRLFFLINAILAGIGALLVFRILADDPGHKSGERIDYAGMAVFGCAVLVLMFALDVGADWGWRSVWIISLFALSAVLLVCFPLTERKVADPMIPSSLMANREFLLTLAASALMMPAVFSGFLYFPQFMQKVLSWSVMQSSIGMAPMMVLLAIGSVISGHLYEKVGPKRLLITGYVMVSAGAASVALVDPAWKYFAVLPAMVLIGFGGSIAVGSSGTAAVGAVAPERSGMVGGLTFTVHLAFGALGVATATAIVYASSLSAIGRGFASAGIDISRADQAKLSAAAPGSDIANRLLAGHDAASADKIRDIMNEAFAGGLSDAYWMALGWALIGVVVVVSINEHRLRTVRE